jgi:hypothetical protein
MRLKNNRYIRGNNTPTVHKTLLLTATPFGNREEHFFLHSRLRPVRNESGDRR